jgi:homoserine kinase
MSTPLKEVTVFAPASVANVAVGYDILGFALEEPGDEIIARFSEEPGLRITTITGDGGRLPYTIAKNTAGYAAHRLLHSMNRDDAGIELEIHKKMPFGSGLGSSAASAAGAVMAINELLGTPYSKKQCLRAAVEGEQVADGAFHADNVAPSLLGGITLIRSNQELDIIQLPVPEDLCAAVVYPHVEVLTKEARSILQESVSLDACIEQTGNVAAFVAALFNRDTDLLSRSLRDVIIEPQRARLIPHFYEVQQAALGAGALGCSISGAGPSIFALCDRLTTAQACGDAMAAVFERAGIAREVFISLINTTGATCVRQTVGS